MADWGHKAPTPPEKENELATARRSRLGLKLFAFYLVLYGGFVFLNAFAPEEMEWTPFAGINIAVLYGLGLITAAFVLALVYDWLCGIVDVRSDKDREAGQ